MLSPFLKHTLEVTILYTGQRLAKIMDDLLGWSTSPRARLLYISCNSQVVSRLRSLLASWSMSVKAGSPPKVRLVGRTGHLLHVPLLWPIDWYYTDYGMRRLSRGYINYNVKPCFIGRLFNPGNTNRSLRAPDVFFQFSPKPSRIFLKKTGNHIDVSIYHESKAKSPTQDYMDFVMKPSFLFFVFKNNFS